MRVKHSPELEQTILAGVRAGGFPHVAAEAAGVDNASFRSWLSLGKRKNARDPYRGFVLRLHQAQAQARLLREIDVAKEDPRFWLKNGPGRDLPESPGWAAMVRPVLTANQMNINLFTSPDVLAFLATLRSVLAPYPEALAALTLALDPRPALPATPSQ